MNKILFSIQRVSEFELEEYSWSLKEALKVEEHSVFCNQGIKLEEYSTPKGVR